VVGHGSLGDAEWFDEVVCCGGFARCADEVEESESYWVGKALDLIRVASRLYSTVTYLWYQPNMIFHTPLNQHLRVDHGGPPSVQCQAQTLGIPRQAGSTPPILRARPRPSCSLLRPRSSR
jgi:hypothetical protein